MRFGRGRLHWYDLVLAALAATIVYPDKVLGWVGEHTGWSFTWGHLLLLELLAVILTTCAMALLMPIYPRLQWWHPVAIIAVFAALRVIAWLVIDFFGLHD